MTALDPHHQEIWTFEVPGPFGVKGSTVSFRDRRGKIRTLTDSKHGRSFAHAVRSAALCASVPRIPKGIGVNVSIIWAFTRPKGIGRDRLYHCVRPDVDKLLRAVLDALTGVAYEDDGQVVTASARKVYAERQRALVIISLEAS